MKKFTPEVSLSTVVVYDDDHQLMKKGQKVTRLMRAHQEEIRDQLVGLL